MATIFEPGVLYFPAGADYSAAAKLGSFMKMSGTTAVICTAAGEHSIGVLANSPESGQPAEIHVGRVTKVRAGGALSVGALIKTSAEAEAAAIVGNTTGGGVADPLLGSNCMGIILEAATADGDLVTAWIAPMGATVTNANAT